MAERPTHYLIIQDKENKNIRTKAGVGWVNAEGWFTFKLGPGVVLTHELCETCWFNAYPTREYEAKIKGEMPPPDDGRQEVPPFTEEDLPF